MAQLLITQCISIGFLCFHLRAWPCALCNSRPVDQCACATSSGLVSCAAVLLRFVADKLDWDNTLRMMTEVHVSLTISVALVFQTHLDVEAPESSAVTRSSEVSRYNLNLQAQKDSYDVLLLMTFLVCVPGCVGRFAISTQACFSVCSSPCEKISMRLTWYPIAQGVRYDNRSEAQAGEARSCCTVFGRRDCFDGIHVSTLSSWLGQ